MPKWYLKLIDLLCMLIVTVKGRRCFYSLTGYDWECIHIKFSRFIGFRLFRGYLISSIGFLSFPSVLLLLIFYTAFTFIFADWWFGDCIWVLNCFLISLYSSFLLIILFPILLQNCVLSFRCFFQLFYCFKHS